MLQRSMVRAKTAIIRRLSPKMSIVHLWMVFFDLPTPHEVFDLLNKEILGLKRFVIETEYTPLRFSDYNISSLRRLSHLFDQFEILVALESNLVKEKERQS